MMRSAESGPSRLAGYQSLHVTDDEREDSSRVPEPAQRGKRRAEGPTRETKSLQACDRCRAKKTRCVTAEDRSGNCKGCKTAALTCTYDMPLTASRTKRIRRGLSVIQAESNTGEPSEAQNEERGPEREDTNGTDGWLGNGSRLASPGLVMNDRRRTDLTPRRSTTVRREGPTAMSYILHSTPTLPISCLTEYDKHRHISMHITSPDSGDGFMLVSSETNLSSSSEAPSHALEALRSPSWNEVVNRLVETYLVHVSPLMPILLREEMGEASQSMIHAMAAVAAARSNCPKPIFDCLRLIVKQEMHEQDTMSNPTRQNVQTLLITCLVDEVALQAGSAAPESISRARLTAAIRMAQDLSMDEALSDTRLSQDYRIWRCAVVIDQWNAARTGARPIVSSSLSPVNASPSEVTDPDDFFHYLFILSLILKSILSTIYGPRGIEKATNVELNKIKDDLKGWKEGLPAKLKFTGVWSSLPAGILHLLHTTTTILLYRPFMRWSFICPPHLDLSLDLPVWLELNPASRQALEWAANQDDLADLLCFGPYTLCLASLIQYHSYARRREWDGVVTLEKFRRDAVERWTARLSEDHMQVQAAQLEVVSLLYAVTQTTLRTGKTSFDSPTSRRGLDPTPGILNRLPETSINGVTFLRDPSHPQGGVLIATQRAAREIKDLPPGTVIIGGPPPPEDGEYTDVANDVAAGGYDVLGHTSGVVTPLMNGMFTTGGLGVGGGGDGDGEGRINMSSTLDWEAMITSFTYPGAEGITQHVDNA
ncbi:hypothetical protein IAR55_006640 [Kwoniella newhampshirensis]|uniref:Zn(2)-C6 fungal-type domain-containing protein n=1 Tax=Kwoniella newhampshirensis TaxID=1651941 RepID=A0AAW0YU66_9TREE